MKRDDCKYLKATAHDGAWEMICIIKNDECTTNWEKYKECQRYNCLENKQGRVERWLPGKKEWDFIRKNIDIMSPDEMADCFKITLGELAREKHEMGLIIDEEGSTREYELKRCLNRFERAKAWEFKTDSYSVANFLHKKRIYDTSEILGRKFT